ncbi:PLP-dependent aminotransferase family protein [Chryseolinea sp. T2]|uniref:MocR-like pyridoxine biosynthesis transcription factor PdxR n=1 Tax=Chryseolinea sp. T2 TaxID=3129255 RepID=UPI0030778EA9
MIPAIEQGDGPRYRQIYEFYKSAILGQQLLSETKLPSYRWLAKQIGVSNNTVLQAYDQLTAEGYLRNEPRKGLYVNKIEIKKWQLPRPVTAQKPRAATRKMPFSASVHLVDQVNFPIRQWRKSANIALDNISYQYEEHESNDTLKEELVKYLYKFRGVNANHEQLVIGSGTSTLLFWLAFVLRKRCSKLLFENPGYTRVRNLFEEFGYQISPLSVTTNGVDLQRLKKLKADLLYLTPSHQYPTGVALPVSHRLQILEWAKRTSAFIIEDDFDCEYRYKTKLMPSLQALDASGNVIYIGTFSSALMPSLRVAYMVLPQPLLESTMPFRYLTNTVSYVTRKTLGLFMEGGHWESHLRKMNKIYRLKYEVCIQALRKLPADKLHYNNNPSGLNIFLRLYTPQTESEIVKRAAEQGILVTPAGQFYMDKKRRKHPEILFEFGSLPQSEIEGIINKLYKAWFL